MRSLGVEDSKFYFLEPWVGGSCLLSMNSCLSVKPQSLDLYVN